MAKVAREELETIILFDNLLKKWHISTDVPSHIRKYKDLLIDCKLTEENGEITYIEGWLEGTVSVQKKRVLSEEQRLAAAERLKAARQKLE